MQQTTKYELNLIETSDPFSPSPLNENTEKTEAALAKMEAAITACRAEHWFVKLIGPLTVQYKGQPIVFNLSGVDLSQYIALIMIGGVINAASALRINDDTTHQYALHGSGVDSGGFTLFTRSAKGKLYYTALYASSCRGQSFDCLMSDVKKISLVSPDQDPGSTFTMYGIKA